MNPEGSSPLVGMVCWWPFDIADIPDGWLLCDGTNGTPDMRGYLAIGARDGFDSGAVLGSATHEHRIRRRLTFEVQDHEHTLSGDGGLPNSGSWDVTPIGGAFSQYDSHVHPFSFASGGQSVAHRHATGKLVDPADSKQLSREQIFVMKT